MSGFDINDFLSNIDQYGVLNNNKFLIQFAAPVIPILVGTNQVSGSSLIELMQFRGIEARLPGVILQTLDVQRYGFGPLQKFPINPMFTDASFTFLADRQSFIYQFIYQWFNGINDFSGSVSSQNDASYLIEYKSNYVVDMYITVYDQYGNQSIQVVLYETYPITLNDIPLAWEENNSIVKLIVGFTFRDWALVN